MSVTRFNRLVSPSLAIFATMSSLTLAGTPGIVPASAKDQVIIDTNGDGLGDTPGSSQAVEGRVGENDIDTDEVRYCVPFVLNDDEAAMIATTGDPVTLHVYLASKMDTTGGSVAVLGLANRDDEGITPIDFHATTVLVQTFAVTNASPGGSFVSVNATNFVKAEINKGARIIVFRFEYRPRPPQTDAQINRFIFGSADSANPPFLRYE